MASSENPRSPSTLDRPRTRRARPRGRDPRGGDPQQERSRRDRRDHRSRPAAAARTSGDWRWWAARHPSPHLPRIDATVRCNCAVHKARSTPRALPTVRAPFLSSLLSLENIVLVRGPRAFASGDWRLWAARAKSPHRGKDRRDRCDANLRGPQSQEHATRSADRACRWLPRRIPVRPSTLDRPRTRRARPRGRDPRGGDPQQERSRRDRREHRSRPAAAARASGDWRWWAARHPSPHLPRIDDNGAMQLRRPQSQEHAARSPIVRAPFLSSLLSFFENIVLVRGPRAFASGDWRLWAARAKSPHRGKDRRDRCGANLRGPQSQEHAARSADRACRWLPRRIPVRPAHSTAHAPDEHAHVGVTHEAATRNKSEAAGIGEIIVLVRGARAFASGDWRLWAARSRSSHRGKNRLGDAVPTCAHSTARTRRARPRGRDPRGGDPQERAAWIGDSLCHERARRIRRRALVAARSRSSHRGKNRLADLRTLDRPRTRRARPRGRDPRGGDPQQERSRRDRRDHRSRPGARACASGDWRLWPRDRGHRTEARIAPTTRCQPARSTKPGARHALCRPCVSMASSENPRAPSTLDRPRTRRARPRGRDHVLVSRAHQAMALVGRARTEARIAVTGAMPTCAVHKARSTPRACRWLP